MPQALRPALKALPEPDLLCSSSPLPFAFCPSSQVMDSPHVHFPPTPTMTSTALTHSPNVYDRAPIHVSHNNCAMPERGERDYSASASDPRFVPPSTSESYFRPLISDASQHALRSWVDAPRASFTPYDRYDPSPALVHDLSSESDESDPCCSPPPSLNIPHISVQFTNGYDLSNSYPYSNDYIPRHRHDSKVPQVETTTPFSLLPCPTAVRTKHKDRDRHQHSSAKKSKKDRLDAGDRVRRASACYGSLLACDPALEGCLGGF